jgi:hypothetical protein
MFDAMNRIVNLEYRVDEQESNGRANTADSAPRRAFADLPTAAATGRWYWVTDGRQTGEGAGSGTGILAVDVNLSGVPTWVRVDDNDTAIAT